MEKPEEPKIPQEIVENIEPEKKTNEYRVLKPEEVERIKKWVKIVIPDWHDRIKPEVIFLPEVSATPVGYIIKEAWKQIYPEENQPKFYRFEPKTIRADREKGLLNLKGKTDHFLKERLPKGKDTKVLVFDMIRGNGDTKDSAERIFLNYAGLNKDNYFFERGPEGLIPIEDGTGLAFDEDCLHHFARQNFQEAKKKRKISSNLVAPTMKKTEKYEEGLIVSPKLIYNYRGRIIKNPEARKAALDSIHDLKLAGNEAGIDVRKEIEKKVKEGEVQF